MPRQPRIDLPGLPQHVIARGNNRQSCFFTDTDRATYLHYLLVAARNNECSVHAYVLMGNHVHLLVTGSRQGAVGRMMQSVGRRYVRALNNVLDRTGTLFEGRYRASPVESQAYFLACMRYIELNPVRAGMVGRPASYRWSSHRFNIGSEPSSLVTPHPEYLQLGIDMAARSRAYRALFDCPLSITEIEKIREHANKGRVLGRPEFLASLEKDLNRCVKIRPAGRPARQGEM
jgi:putative transposase